MVERGRGLHGRELISFTKVDLASCIIAAQGLLKHGLKEAAIGFEHSFVIKLVQDEIHPVVRRAGASGLEPHPCYSVLDGAADPPGRRESHVRVEVR